MLTCLSPAYDASYLSTLAGDVVAPAVLLYVLPALWAGLGVCGHPVSGLTITGSLLVPLLPSESSLCE